MKKPLGVWVATWFLSGLLRGKLGIGGGTWGSIVAMPLCLMLLVCARATEIGIVVYFLALAVILVAGVKYIPAAESFLGGRTNHRGIYVCHDQNEIVIDEVWGVLITATPLLWMSFSRYWIATVLVFGLFRIFDVLKPWPVKLFDRWVNPWGVMLDDGMAAIYAASFVACINWVFPF